MPKIITRALTIIAAIAVIAIIAINVNSRGRANGTRPKVAHAVARDQYKPVVGVYGGQMIMPSLGAPKSFNPITSSEQSTDQFTQYMFLGLTSIDPWTLEVMPSMAESWKSDESGLVWTVKLRKDVRWSDGVPFTADDVVFTFDTIYDPHVVTAAKSAITGPHGEKWKVEKIDDYTVRFTLYDKNAIFDQLIGQPNYIAKHKFERVVKEGRLNEAMSVNSRPEDIPVTGPFMFDSYDGTRVVLKRNPYFYKKDDAGNRLPYLDRLVYIVAADLDVVSLKFLQGETDYTFILGKDYPNFVRPRENPDYTVYLLGPRWDEAFLMFNQNTGTNPLTHRPYVEAYKLKWFRDVRFRQAMAHAIDRKFMADAILNGLAYPEYGPMTLHPNAPMAEANVLRFEYDPNKAEALLAEMGLKRNADGWLEDKEGHTVEFNLTSNVENEVRAKVAAVIRQDLEKLGIRVNFRAMSFNTLITKLDETFDWEACILSFGGNPEPIWGSNIWKSGGRTHQWFPGQKTPSTPWEAEIDKIYDEAAREMDPVKRKALYARWQVIAAQEQPMNYTVVNEAMAALRNRFGNIFPSPGTYPDVENALVQGNIEEIFVLPPGKKWPEDYMAQMAKMEPASMGAPPSSEPAPASASKPAASSPADTEQ